MCVATFNALHLSLSFPPKPGKKAAFPEDRFSGGGAGGGVIPPSRFPNLWYKKKPDLKKKKKEGLRPAFFYLFGRQDICVELITGRTEE